MSLAQLLAAGRSLINGEDRENHYKLPRRQWLPTFGAGINPFDPTAKLKSHPGPALPIATASEPVAVVKAPHGRLPTPEIESRTELVAAAPTVPARHPGWLSRLNPFALSGGGTSALRGGSRRRAGEESQAELSLESVKVVRNDLSDGDEETLAPLSGHRRPVSPSAPERDVEAATVDRLNQSFRRVEQVSLF